MIEIKVSKFYFLILCNLNDSVLCYIKLVWALWSKQQTSWLWRKTAAQTETLGNDLFENKTTIN